MIALCNSTSIINGISIMYVAVNAHKVDMCNLIAGLMAS